MSEPVTVKTHPLRKTKAQLVEEVESLRLRVAELEDAAAPHEWQGRALRESEESKVSGLGAIAADGTERKHAEARRTIGLCQDGVSVNGNLGEQNFDELIGMFAHAPIGLCCFDRDLRFIFINDYLAALNGISVEEHHGRSIREVIPDVATGVEEQLRQVFETGESIIGGTVDAETPAHPGRIRSFQHHYYAIKSETGTVLRVACVVQEITVRKQAEEALRESEARLRSIMDHTPAEIFLLDTDYRYVLVNWEFERRYNLTEEEVKGRTIHEFFPADVSDEFSAQDREVLETAKAMVKEQQIEYGGALHTDLEVKFPIVDSTGAVTGIGGIATDITELKRAEEALRESEVRYRTLATVAPVGIFRTDAQGLVTYVNEKWCEIGGMAPEEAKGTGWLAGLHPEDRENIAAKWDAFAINQTTYRTEYRYQRPDGVTTYCYVQALPVTDTDGNLTGYVGYVVDITERKRAEDALQEARDELESRVNARTKELRELSAQLIHAQEEERKRVARELHDDFNQRLALVAIDIEQLARERAGSPEDFDGHIRDLLDRVKELSLDMHRLSHRLHPAALDHLSLVTAVKSLCREMSALHDHRIRFTGTEIPDVVPKDVALCCYRIVQEALRNVIKHSGAREAHVELARTKQGLELHVRDQGAGFDVAGVGSRGGLGLISMRERLRLVGGRIAIKSSEAHGTEIDVVVPLSAADAV